MYLISIVIIFHLIDHYCYKTKGMMFYQAKRFEYQGYRIAPGCVISDFQSWVGRILKYSRRHKVFKPNDLYREFFHGQLAKTYPRDLRS